MIGTSRLRLRRHANPVQLQNQLGNITASTGGNWRLLTIRGQYPISNVADQYVLNSDRGNVIIRCRRGSQLYSFLTAYSPNRRGLRIGPNPAEPNPNSAVATVAGVGNTNIAKGATSIQIVTGSASDGWYFIWDTANIETQAFATPRPNQNPPDPLNRRETRNVGGELIQITGVTSGVATLAYGVAQAYTKTDTLKIIPVPAGALQNVRIRDFRVKCQPYITNAGIGAGPQGLLFGAYCYNVDIQRYRSIGGDNASIYMLYSRGVSVSASQGRLCTGEFPLNSFCFCFQRTVNVTVTNVSFSEVEYGVSFAAGCAGFTVDGVIKTGNENAAFDLHGGGTIHGLAKNIQAYNSQIQIGNPGWTLSCKDITVEDSGCAYVGVKGWARDCLIQRVKAKHLDFLGSRKGTNAAPSQAGPTNIQVKNCTFKVEQNNASFGRGALWISSSNAPDNKDGTAKYYGEFTNIEIENSTFETNQSGTAPYATIFVSSTVATPVNGDLGPVTETSTFHLRYCTFVQTGNLEGMDLKVLGPFTGKKLTFNTQGCEFQVKASSPAAWVGKGSGAASSTIEVVPAEEDQSFRRPSPDTPDQPTSIRILESGDFTGLTFVEP